MTARHVDIFIRGHDQASRAMRSIGGVIGTFTGQLFSLRGAAAAALAGFGISSSIEEFGKQELASRKLSDALLLLGDTSKQSRDEWEKFAAGIQATTTVADDTVLEMAALGAAIGHLQGDQLKQATKAAIGLSKAYGIDTVAAMRLVSRAAMGQTQTLARHGIMLDASLTDQEKFNQLLAIGAQNFSIATGEAQTATGQWAMFKNRVGDLKEEIGAAFLPILNQVGEFMEQRLFPIVKVLTEWWAKWGAVILKSIALLYSINLAIRAVANAQKLLAVGQAILQALSGPKGWIMLAVSVGVAGAAIASVQNQFDEFERDVTSDMPAAAASVAAMRREVDQLGISAGQAGSGLTEMATRAGQIFEQTRTPQEKFNARMKQAGELFRANKISLDTYHREQKAARAEIETSETALAAYHRQLRHLNGLLAEGSISQAYFNIKSRELNATLQGTLAPSIAELTADLKDQIQTFGMTTREAELYRLQLAGASDDALKFARLQDETLTFLEQQNALREEGVQLTEQMRTEEERRAEALARAHKLLSEGAITQQTFDRLVASQSPRRQRQPFGGGGVTESRFLTRSSGSDVATSLEKVVAKQEQMRKEMEKQRRAAEATRDAVREMADGAVFVRRSRL